MLTIELINQVLALVGEQPLASSAGTLGQLTRSVIDTALQAVTQSVRPQTFERIYALTTTNNDYTVPVGAVPSNIIQIYNCFWRQGLVSPYKFVRLDTQPYEVLDQRIGYTIIGNSLFVSPLINRSDEYPLTIHLHTLTAPVLPTADDEDAGIPQPLLSAVKHQAAAIMLLSYVDDPNAASMHENIANQFKEMLRLQYGISRNREFNIGDRRGV